MHRLVIVAIAITVAVIASTDAIAGRPGDEQAVFMRVFVGGAVAGAVSALRIASMPMVDSHDPFVARRNDPASSQPLRGAGAERVSGRAIVPRMFGDALYGALAGVVAGIVTTVVNPADAVAIAFFPLFWVFGSIPGVAAGAIIALVFGTVRDVVRGRTNRRNSLVHLLVAAMFTLVVAGLVCAAFSIRVEEGARLRRSMLWVLFGGHREGISVIDGPLPWIARILLVLTAAILLTLITWSIRSTPRPRRAPRPPSLSREERRERRQRSERRRHRRSLETD